MFAHAMAVELLCRVQNFVVIIVIVGWGGSGVQIMQDFSLLKFEI